MTGKGLSLYQQHYHQGSVMSSQAGQSGLAVGDRVVWVMLNYSYWGWRRGGGGGGERTGQMLSNRYWCREVGGGGGEDTKLHFNLQVLK